MLTQIGLTDAAITGISGIQATVNQIDDLAVDGLAGTYNSLAYRVHEIERHLHNRERWRGKLAVQTATDWADDNLLPFRAISGDNAYGSDPNDEALVLGTDDTPIIAGSAYFDLHELLVLAASSDTAYKLRIVYGTGTMADAIAAGQFTEVMFIMDTAVQQQPHGPVPITMPRVATDTQVWAQVWNATDNATIDFVVGLHEYPG
jgi:hypothetical protein